MLQTTSSFVVAVALAIGISGCGNGSLSSGSCRQTTKFGSANITICTDYEGLTGDQAALMRSQCAGNVDGGGGAMTTGVFSDSMCNTSGSLGGCRAASGSYASTVWYFPGSVFTVELVRSTCMQANLMYVTP